MSKALKMDLVGVGRKILRNKGPRCGEELSVLRKCFGVTQARVSEWIGVSQASVCALEKDKSRTLDMTTRYAAYCLFSHIAKHSPLPYRGFYKLK